MRLLSKRHLKTTLLWIRQYSTQPNQVRVRFAPSPTGQLHVGGLRTALFNYMYARAHDGVFILRIEDTDQTRLVLGAQQKLIDMLHWTGIQVDEGPGHGGDYGPYIQSERSDLYRQHTEKLIQSGHAYRCFCTEKRLALLRKSQHQRREPLRYDNRCRAITAADEQQYMDEGKPYVVRLKMSHDQVTWTDMVYGDISHDVAAVEGDPVLMKSDGLPTYHLANVVDDHHMRITHVLRGQEWLTSGTKHQQLYRAFGWSPPQFGHLPSILNVDGKKLSKRQNDMHVEHLKSCGYAPEVLVNWLCSMSSGFSCDPSHIHALTLPQLTQYFDLGEVKRHGARLNFQKLDLINQEHLATELQRDKSQMVSKVKDLVHKYFDGKSQEIDTSSVTDENIGVILEIIFTNKRIHRLDELVSADWLFLWRRHSHLTASQYSSILDHRKPSKSNRNHFSSHTTLEVLQLIKDTLASLSDQQLPEFGNEVRLACNQQKCDHVAAMQLTRLALYGDVKGPSLVELIGMLGKQIALSRLETAIDICQRGNLPGKNEHCTEQETESKQSLTS